MHNPWSQLPSTGEFVLSGDRESITAYNQQYGSKQDVQLHPELLPEPFIGHPSAPVYLLSLNPGFSDEDRVLHRNAAFCRAVEGCLQHEERDWPFYYLNPDFADSPGAKWWTGKTRRLAEKVGMQALAQNLFCVELFPYHSRKYQRIPKRISPNGLVPSSEYSLRLVRQAIAEEKRIVVMRARKHWKELVPELRGYERRIWLNSAQNVCLSPGNMETSNFEALVAECGG